MDTLPDTLLIVEDDAGLQRQLRWCFDAWEVVFAEDRVSAIAQLRRHEPQVVLQDLGLPPDAEGVEEGMRTLGEILKLAPQTKVIVVTGNGDEQSALRAVDMGAYDFYQKPLDTDVVALIVERAFHIWNLEAQNRALRRKNESPLTGLITASEPVLEACRLVEKVAPTHATALVQGETGTGKELIARALHELSPRKKHRFVAINCAAIPENLLESELFGYEKGAFTGAARSTQGKIEYAHEGTLFLDEIGDMPAALQSKLLRFLQERSIERLGGREAIDVDVRVVCATHRNLHERFDREEFREDLYYRISEIVIQIPPLKERGEDALLLARHFIDQAAARHGRPLRGLAKDAIETIGRYPWPGNVRELENKINRAVIMAENNLVTAADLNLPASEDAGADFPLNLRQVRSQAEHEALARALHLAAGNISQAARELGVSRPALYDLMSKHELDTF